MTLVLNVHNHLCKVDEMLVMNLKKIKMQIAPGGKGKKGKGKKKKGKGKKGKVNIFSLLFPLM